jgi:hypothetical protein
VVLAEVEGHALRVTSPSGQLLLVQDPRLQWPDSLARGPEDWIYVTVNQLNLHPAMNRGEEESRPPYGIFRVRLTRGVPLRETRPAPTETPADAGAE